ncbi:MULTISPECIES: HAMP domain-containing sensor histidine kinase [unclassified Pseudodesulfovibrio]|uniref:HAMP domain-containing sensor histidine kinase n=1 Tax=unclassified Pseudodesulfovibrio TaxID=2661612 RepID=UPI0019D42221|nr:MULTISPECIES: HAMP domain-containing sensor histidine kinase [unclassified Pseudodesulfovibrio]MCJ2163502.1 HAMP domain-containing histidine kinase [Pseudodesulfovibrio sp. S3-i]
MLPAVVLSLFLTGWMVISYATEATHEAIFRYSQGVLDAYVTQDLAARARLLKDNYLDNVPSFVAGYQQEALAAAAELNLIWPGHLFIIDGNRDIILCTTGEMPDRLPPAWDETLEKMKHSTETVHGHVSSSEGFVAHYFEPWNWSVFILIKGDFLHARVRHIWLTVAIIGAITCMVLVLIIGFVLHKLIVKPVNLLQNATEQIAMGEMGISIPVGDGDEFGDLSRDIEGMSYRIQQSREKLQQAVDELRTMDAIKTSLIANLSHELRTPLTSIIGFAKLSLKKIGSISGLSESADGDGATLIAVQSALETVSTQGECMEGMIGNIITLISLIQKDAAGEREPLDVGSVVTQIADEMRAGIECKGLSLRVETPDEPLIVLVDRSQIALVLRHYLSNAMVFTGAGGILVRAEAGNGEIVVEVRDTGPGLSPENARKVFDEFYQAGDLMTEKPRGLGIGLSICRKIVELHDGQVWVESIPGKGSSFFFSLPTR